MENGPQPGGVQGGADDRPGAESPDIVARRLTGQLRCLACGYDLRGLSIRAECPECGVPVRATLLGAVDPRAEELGPLSSAPIVANGLVVWTLGALIACLSVWALRLDEVMRATIDIGFGTHWFRVLGFTALVASALASFVLIRPHARMSRAVAARAALGVAAYAPLLLIYWTVYMDMDLSSASPLINPGGQRLDRSLLRIGLALCVAIIVVGVRPSAVSLASRSVLVRTGRVDRQSMYALIAAFFVGAVGDALNVLGTLTGGVAGDLLTQLHIVFVAIGSVLVTLGLANMVIDTLRLRPILLHRGVGLSDIFETNTQRESRTGAIGAHERDETDPRDGR